MDAAEYLETYHGVRPYCGCSIGPGWFNLARLLVVALERKGFDTKSVAQIKEKFGTLRFYYDGPWEAYQPLVRSAEAASSETCEACGMDGKLGGRGWISTLCEQCRST